jgi:hypothetical protein
MKLDKAKRPVVNGDYPWADDVLERKKLGEFLTPLVATINQPFVISLHASYGTGKSFFLERWREELKSQDFCTVLFNAWETDFSQDALSAFIVALKKGLSEGSNKKFTSKFKALTKAVGNAFLPVLVKGRRASFLGQKLLKNLSIRSAVVPINGRMQRESLPRRQLRLRRKRRNRLSVSKSSLGR